MRNGVMQGDLMGLFARGRDGQVGWLHPVRYNSADEKSIEVELGTVGDVRGRLTDQNARPIAGVEVKPVLLRPSGAGTLALYPAQPGGGLSVPDHDGIGWLVRAQGHSPRRRGSSRRLRPPPSARPRSPGTRLRRFRSSSTAAWDESRAGSGRPMRGSTAAALLGLKSCVIAKPALSSPPIRASLYLQVRRGGQGRAFQFDRLPPGRYVVNAYFDKDGIIATKPEHEVEVGPAVVAPLEIPIQRLPRISGRVVDAQTGKGIAGIRLQSLRARSGRELDRGRGHDRRRGAIHDRGAAGKDRDRVGGGAEDIPRARVRPPPRNWPTPMRLRPRAVEPEARLEQPAASCNRWPIVSRRPIPERPCSSPTRRRCGPAG